MANTPSVKASRRCLPIVDLSTPRRNCRVMLPEFRTLRGPRYSAETFSRDILPAITIRIAQDLIRRSFDPVIIRCGHQGADQSNFLSLFSSVIEAAVVFFTWPFLDGCMPLPRLAVKPS